MEEQADKFINLIEPNKLEVRKRQKPLIIILPEKRWHDLDWRGVWRQRDLLASLVSRDLRLRYRQTFLGVLWAILQPLAPMLVFTLVFHRVFVAPETKIPYSLFVLAGLVVWLYFSNAVTNAGTSFANNAYLIGKVYFPRLLLPLATVLAGAVDFAVGCSLLLIILFFFGFGLSPMILLLPLLWLLAAWLALAIGMILASLSVIYRDIRNLLPFLIQLWLFLTPVVYPAEVLPERWRFLLQLNPVTGIVENFRVILFGGELNLSSLGISVLLTTILSVAAMLIFVRMEKYTADYL